MSNAEPEITRADLVALAAHWDELFPKGQPQLTLDEAFKLQAKLAADLRVSAYKNVNLFYRKLREAGFTTSVKCYTDELLEEAAKLNLSPFELFLRLDPVDEPRMEVREEVTSETAIRKLFEKRKHQRREKDAANKRRKREISKNLLRTNAIQKRTDSGKKRTPKNKKRTPAGKKRNRPSSA